MSAQSVKAVSGIIVNYKSAQHVVRCIDSLRSQEGVALEIIVVDNNSGDEDLLHLSGISGDNICLIRNPENFGFARANNIAASKASGEFLLMINPDAEFCGTQDLSQLCSWLEAHPEAGLVGPEIYEPEKSKYVKPRMRYPDSDSLRFTPGIKSLPGDIAWLLGACLLMRRETFTALGGFDQDYFLYGEDVDLCIRTRKAGLLVGHCEDSHVRHVGGASAATIPSIEKFLRKKRGYFLFCNKHYDSRDVRHIAQGMRISSKIKLLALTIQKMFGFISEAELLRQQPKWQAEHQVSGEVLQGISAS
jgi:GT2 family glycosyltransferase